MADPSLWVGHPFPTFQPSQFLSILAPIFRVWVDLVYCLCLSPALWPRGPQRGAWTHLSPRASLSGWGDICTNSHAVEGGSLDYDGLEGEEPRHKTHQCAPSAHTTSILVLFCSES